MRPRYSALIAPAAIAVQIIAAFAIWLFSPDETVTLDVAVGLLVINSVVFWLFGLADGSDNEVARQLDSLPDDGPAMEVLRDLLTTNRRDEARDAAQRGWALLNDSPSELDATEEGTWTS